MTDKHTSRTSQGLNLGDIYYILFRHKWKILTLWTVGALGAAAIWFSWPVIFQSHAQLLVRYVLDNRSLSPVSAGDIQTPDSRGASVLNSEMAILQSFDLAKQVAESIGPSNVLAKAGGGDALNRAAGMIRSGLSVEAPKGSAVMFVTFEHPDPALVQTILSQVITAYLTRHAEIHQAAGTLDDVLTRQTDQLRSELKQTDDELRNVQAKAGIISLADSKKAFTEQIARIREGLFAAEAELAGRQATLNTMTNLMPVGLETNLVTHSDPPPPEKLTDYKKISSLLDTLRKLEQDRMLQYTPESPRLLEVRRQIATNQETKNQLEKEYPQLLNTQPEEANSDGQATVSRRDIMSQVARIREVQSRIDTLNQQLAEVRKEAAAIGEIESQISELERKKLLLEQNYTHFSASLNNARFDEALGAGRISNIGMVETPTPPMRDVGPARKASAFVLGGSFVLALALAFLIELYFDRSLKRPIEIENRLHIPLFLSIPRVKMSRKQITNAERSHSLLISDAETANGSLVPNSGTPQAGAIQTGKDNPALDTYFETLRDRLILYFEAQNLTHTPKLVAVTGCAKDTGISTVASGLAAALSETGDGNVLLVDMNELERGAAAYFHKGKLECGLDEALEKSGKRESALVQDNLYVVADSPANGNLPRILHKRFSNLMPKLRASDYDYIIFDMPPVSQISPTTRLAQFMDMVFMVVEAEKTDRDVVKRAADLLAKANPNVGVVFNKNRTYVPRQLQQEL